jgi:hypothetical protein
MMRGDDVLMMPVARRVQVLAGPGQRGRWSAEAKAQTLAGIVQAILALGQATAPASAESELETPAEADLPLISGKMVPRTGLRCLHLHSTGKIEKS